MGFGINDSFPDHQSSDHHPQVPFQRVAIRPFQSLSAGLHPVVSRLDLEFMSVLNSEANGQVDSKPPVKKSVSHRASEVQGRLRETRCQIASGKRQWTNRVVVRAHSPPFNQAVMMHLPRHTEFSAWLTGHLVLIR